MNKSLLTSIVLISLADYAFSSPLGVVTINMPLEEGGDIMKDNETEAETRSVGYNPNRGVWPGGVIPYEIGSEFKSVHRDMIIESQNMITQQTRGCITFVERTTQRNYVGYQNSGGCSSWIGLINRGRQEINLNIPGCMFRGTIVHEIMHALGFLHEQNRPDRDRFVSIITNNIEPNRRDQFEITSGSNTYNTPYDFTSIMHYDEFTFGIRTRTGRLQTIVPRDRNVDVIPVATRTGNFLMSSSDVDAVNARYCSSSPTVPSSGGQDAYWCAQVDISFCGFNANVGGTIVGIAASCPQKCG